MLVESGDREKGCEDEDETERKNPFGGFKGFFQKKTLEEKRLAKKEVGRGALPQGF